MSDKELVSNEFLQLYNKSNNPLKILKRFEHISQKKISPTSKQKKVQRVQHETNANYNHNEMSPNTSIRMAISKRLARPSVDKDVKQLELSYTAGGNRTCNGNMNNILALYKVKLLPTV